MSGFQNPPFRGDIHWALQSMVALGIPSVLGVPGRA